MASSIDVEYTVGSKPSVQLANDPQSNAIIVSCMTNPSIEYDLGVRLSYHLTGINGNGVWGLSAHEAEQTILNLLKLHGASFSLQFTAPSFQQAPIAIPSEGDGMDSIYERQVTQSRIDTYDLVWGQHDGDFPFSLRRCGVIPLVVRNFIPNGQTSVGLDHLKNGDILERVNGVSVSLSTTSAAWATKPCVLRFRRPTEADKSTAAAMMHDAISDLKHLHLLSSSC